MLRKNFRSPNFRGPSWPKKVPETNRESREFPITFGSPRRASNAAWRPCFVKISGSKIFADHLSKKVPKTTLQQQSSQDNPRIPEFPILSGSPRRASNAAWRPCFAKSSVRQIFADQVGRRRFPRQPANPGNLPQFLAPRVVLQTLRGAHAPQKFPWPKFSRTKLDEEGSKDEPRIPGISHNFWFPTLCFKRCVAPMLWENVCFQNFCGPSWRKKVPRKIREPGKLTTIFCPPCCVREACESKVVTKEATCL